MKSLLLLVLAFGTGWVLADEVRLQDGRTVRGRILSETEYEVEIETARSDDGVIRYIQIIDRSAVDSMARGEFALPASPAVPAAPVVVEDTLPEEELNFGLIETWLESGIGILQEGQYDQAIRRYRRVLDHPRLVELSRGEDRDARQAVELRSRALRLTLAAIEGKVDYLEEREDQAKARVEAALRQAEDDLRDFERAQRNETGGDFIEMRSRQRRTAKTGLEGFQARVERAQAQVRSFQAWSSQNALDVQNLKAEIELLEELEKQLKDSIKRKFR